MLNAKKDEVNAALEKAFMPKDKMSIQFAPLVINTGGKLVVVDTGNGPAAFASSKGNVGQFASNMAAAGLDPKTVDMVVISHFHGDHINGLLTADNTLAFPECRGAGAGRRVEIFHGRRRDGQADHRPHEGRVRQRPPRFRRRTEEEGHAL